MNEQLTNLCEQYIRNRDTIKSVSTWDSALIIPMAAMIMTSRGQSADAEKIKACRKLLEQHTSIFSNFRGNTKLPTTAQLACADDALDRMQQAMAIYAALKEHLFGSEELAYISVVLTNMISRERAEETAVQAKSLFKRMRKEHPFLTGGEDSGFAVLMTFSEKSEDTLVAEMEQCYKLLKPHFFNSNAVQMLSHVLVFGSSTPEARCEAFLTLWKTLGKSGLDYGRSYELSVLGSLSMLGVPAETVCAEIAQVNEFLADQKGYGLFSIDKATRMMHSAMLVSILHSSDPLAETAAISGTIAMIAAQQAATCAVISSTVVNT